MTRSSSSIALNKRRGAEILETGARTGEGLATTLSTRGRVHGETVTDPHRFPIVRTVGWIHVLAVHRYHVCLKLADHTPGYEFSDGSLCHWHHGYWFICGEPVRLVIPARVVTHIIEITEQERHRVELRDT